MSSSSPKSSAGETQDVHALITASSPAEKSGSIPRNKGSIESEIETEDETVTTAEGTVKYIRVGKKSVGEGDQAVAAQGHDDENELPVHCENVDHFVFGVGPEAEYSEGYAIGVQTPSNQVSDSKGERESQSSSEKDRDMSTISNLEKRLAELDEEKRLIVQSLESLDAKPKGPVSSSHPASKTSSNMEADQLASEVHLESVMSQSVGSEESASSDDRFVKVKICEVEDSSKASSQSGKENLEFEEQIASMSSECKRLQDSLSESQEQYLKVKLELESHLLEAKTECDAERRSSSEILRLKDKLSKKDDELLDLRILIEEALILNGDENHAERTLTELLSSLISSRREAVLTRLDAAIQVSEAEELGIGSRKLAELKIENERLEIRDIEVELTNAKIESATQNQELENLRKLYSEKDVEAESFKSQLQELKDNEANIIAGYQAVSSELTNLQQSHAALSAQLEFTQDELSVKNEVSKEELDRLKEELLAKDEDMMEIQGCMDEIRTSLQEKTNELEAANEKFVCLKTDALKIRLREDELRTSLDEKTNELKTANEKFESLKLDALTIQQREDEHQNEILEKNIELNATKAKVDKLKKALVSLKAKRQIANNATESTETHRRPSPSDDTARAQDLVESRIVELQTENQILKDQLLILGEDKQQLECQMKSMTEEISQLESAANEREVNLTKNGQQVDELEAVLNEKNSEIEKLVQSIDCKTEELTSCANLKGEEMEKTIQEYHMMLENSTSHSRQLQNLLDQKILFLEEILAEKNSGDLNVAELESRLVQKDAIIQSMEEDINDYMEERIKYRDSLARANQTHDQMDGFIAEMTHRLTIVEEANAALVNEKDDLHGDILSKGREITRLSELLGAKDTEIKQLSSIATQLQQDCHSLREESAKSSTSLLELNTKLDTMTSLAVFDVVKAKRDELIGINAELSSKVQAASNEITLLKECIEELKLVRTERDMLHNRLLTTDSHIQQVQVEFERKCVEVDTLREMEVLAIKQELDQMKVEKDELQYQFLQKHEITLRLESENANLRNEIQTQELALIETRERAGFFETEIRSVTHSTAHLETDINRLRETVIGLEIQLAQANTQIQALKERIEKETTLQEDKTQENSLRLSTSTENTTTPYSVLLSSPSTELVVQSDGKDFLENKIELLQSKISEIEVSEIKSFEECLMLKGWVRQLEMENLKYQDHLRALQSTKDGGASNAKAKTLQDEVLRLVHTLQERDNRCGHLTAEITRLLEERDGLQLKLSDVLKRNVSLIQDNKQGPELADAPAFDTDSVQRKISELEHLNYAINIDLRREKEARRLVQEQLLLSQNSRFYFGRGGMDSTIDISRQPHPPSAPPLKSPLADESTNLQKPVSSSSGHHDSSNSRLDDSRNPPPIVHI